MNFPELTESDKNTGWQVSFDLCDRLRNELSKKLIKVFTSEAETILLTVRDLLENENKPNVNKVYLVYCEEQRECRDHTVVDRIFSKKEDADMYSRDKNVYTHFSHIEELEVTDSFEPPNV